MLIRDDDAALAVLHQLRAIGVRIALDDFGTGYSSLSYLQRFPFDKIKIDRCFITDIAEPDGSASIVQAVVNIAAARHMTTTAEGVETEAATANCCARSAARKCRAICSARQSRPPTSGNCCCAHQQGPERRKRRPARKRRAGRAHQRDRHFARQRLRSREPVSTIAR